MRSPLLALSLLVSFFQIQASAQVPPAAPPAAIVEVAAVKFASVRAAGDGWLEAEVELDVRPGGKAVTGEFVDRVRVTLSLGAEGAESRPQKFYRASAEAITLEGGRATLRFYLPPEVVKRDRLRVGDLRYYTVDLAAGGAPLPPGKASVSGDFKGPDSVRGFQSKVAAEAATNEGVLMPQHLTPFASDSQRHSPTILRREPQR